MNIIAIIGFTLVMSMWWTVKSLLIEEEIDAQKKDVDNDI